jgi:hypothetical protein
VALFATAASITILCTDAILRFLDLENLKTKYSISIPGNPIPEGIKYKELEKKNLYVQLLLERRAVFVIVLFVSLSVVMLSI